MARAPEFTIAFAHAAAARSAEQVHVPLFEGAPDEVPVLALLEDGEPLTDDRLDALGADADELFEEALDELGDRDAGWKTQVIPIKGGAALTLAARVGEEGDALEMLDPDVLEAACELLGATELAVAIPSRGSLLVTDAQQRWQLVAAFATAARLQYEGCEEGAIWPGILRTVGGKIVGVIDLRTASLDEAAGRLPR